MKIKIEGELPLDGTTQKLYISEPRCTASQETGSWRIDGTSYITLEPTIIYPGDKDDTAIENMKVEFP